MKFSDHLIILSTIILGFWLDNSLNSFTIKLYLELNFGFLIFTYWVFAMPEKLQSSAALFYGLVADLFSCKRCLFLWKEEKISLIFSDIPLEIIWVYRVEALIIPLKGAKVS